MDDRLKGQDAPSSSSTERPAKAADSKQEAQDLPLSPADFPDDSPEIEGDGRAKSREILRGMMKGDGKSQSDDEPGDQGDDEGEKEAKSETAAADAKPAEKTPDAKKDGDADLSEARDALIRDGWTSADLEKLTPERVGELGTRARSRQKQQDGFGRQKSEEISALKAKLAELEGAATGTANQPPAAETIAAKSPAAATADPYADPALKEVGAELDKLGEYASPEVKEVVKSSLAKMFQHLEQRMTQQIGSVTQAAEQQMLSAARVKATEKYPAIKDDAKFGAVTQKMRVLAKTGAYGPGDMDTLMEDACKLTLPAASIQDVQRKMLESSQRVHDGQMDAGQRSKTAADGKPLSASEQSRQILRLMSKGKTADEARSIVMAR